jgi:glutathione S-transferase
MKLYTQIVAPNPTKVELYLAEKAAAGAPIEIERVSVDLMGGAHRTPAITEKNALQRVPFLELDDGSILTESLPIIEYLEELHPYPAFIGETALERAHVRALERMIDGDILRGSATIVHAKRSPTGMAPNPAVAEFFLERIKAPLASLDALLADGRPFVAGARVTIADFPLAAALQFARFGRIGIVEPYSHIAAWDQRFRQREAAQKVLIL